MRLAAMLCFALLILVAMVAVSADAQLQPLVLYDDFNSGRIDPNKWFGFEPFSRGAEARRQVQGGRLRIAYRAYGGTTSNFDVTGSTLRVHFLNPSAVTAIRFKVGAITFQMTNCPLNTEPVRVRARTQGNYFNAGTPGPPGDFTNDVFATIRVQRRGDSADPAGVMRVLPEVFRCDDRDCIAATDLFFGDMGTMPSSELATLMVQWDPDNHRFIFMFNATIALAPYTVSDTARPANPIKRLEAQLVVPNCTATPRPTGFIDASFDDVFVNASAPSAASATSGAPLRGSSVPQGTRVPAYEGGY